MIRVDSYDWGHEGLVQKGFGGIADGWVSNKANDAGGVSVKFNVTNYGKKAVRKYTLYFEAYDGAGDPAKCTIRGESVRGVVSSDAIPPYNHRYNLLFENAWYNHAIRSVKLKRIEVMYSDMTTQSCDGNYEPTEDDKPKLNPVKEVLGFLAIIGMIAFIPLLLIIMLIIMK